MVTGREHFSCKESIVSQILVLLVSNGQKILSNVNVVVRGQVKSENSSLPVAVRFSKMRVLKLPNHIPDDRGVQTIENILKCFHDSLSVSARPQKVFYIHGVQAPFFLANFLALGSDGL